MLRLFRKARENLLLNRKYDTYLVYLSAEMILVILGILIALQINNWNEQRKIRNAEINYLIELKIENEKNLYELERVIKLNQRNIELAHHILSITRQPTVSNEKLNIESILMEALMTEVQYRPGSGVIEEIISSGKLSMFSNANIRREIASWKEIMQNVRFQEMEHNNSRDRLLRFSFANVDIRSTLHNSYENSFGVPAVSTELTKYDFLNSLEFDNQILSFYLTAFFLNKNVYKKMEIKLKDLIDTIDEELN